MCDDEKDDPAKFTRTWFAWANTWFGELIVKLNEKWPNLSNGVSETAD
ncbi:MAG: glycoside hydrolase family 125 protein [Candidatus Acidiferrum sp.]